MEVRNRVAMRVGSVVSEVPASEADRRCWLELIPADGAAVLLVRREHSAALDTDGWPAPGDVLDEHRLQFATLEAALDHLNDQGVDTSNFTEPWKTDYPF